MVYIKEVSAKPILDSRKDKTIQVTIKTNFGTFSASSPTGKSIGKFEKKPYIKSLDHDIKVLKQLSDYFSEESLTSFDDLKRIEDIVDKHLGANTIFALESAVLKAIAKEQKKEIWQVINPQAKKTPRLVGNAIGGGKHSRSTDFEARKPDFQEFLLIPKTKTVKEAFELNKKVKDAAKTLLKEFDQDFQGKQNDENAWMTLLNEKIVLDILYKLKQRFNIDIGLDIAASSFYNRGKYKYENPKLTRTKEEQIFYVSSLIKNFDLLYIEDPLQEEDFEGFAKFRKKFSNLLIVGDDLIVTNFMRLGKAIKEKAVNAIIIKPNQCGSLLEVKEIVELAKKNNIKTVFSHRSGETNEEILADLAVGFEADFFKCGIDGKEREVKLKRLIEIEKSL